MKHLPILLAFVACVVVAGCAAVCKVPLVSSIPGVACPSPAPSPALVH